MLYLRPYVSKKRPLVIFIQMFKVIEQYLFPGGKETISAVVFFGINILLEIFGIDIHVRNLAGESVYNRTIYRNVVKVKCFSRCVILNFKGKCYQDYQKETKNERMSFFVFLFFVVEIFYFHKGKNILLVTLIQLSIPERVSDPLWKERRILLFYF